MDKFDRKKLEEIWQKVPVDYYEKGIKTNIGQKWWHKHKFLSTESISSDLNPSKILDVGSNGGNLTAQIAKIFPQAECWGIDIYPQAIKYAQKKYPKIHFRVADAQALPFKNSLFDLMFCLETLEHVVSPSKVLKEIKRCLKRGGRAIISMDTGTQLFRMIWFFWTKFGRGKVWQDSHLYGFNYQRLKKMILAEGFLIEREIISHLGMAVTFRVRADDH